MCALTVDVFDHVDAEAVAGDGGQHLPSAPPPGQVVRRTPGGDGAEEELEVVLLGQLLGRRHKATQLHQDLRSATTDIKKGCFNRGPNDNVADIMYNINNIVCFKIM